MKQLPLILLAVLTALVSACSFGDNDNVDTTWADDNNSWYIEQKSLKNPDGTLFYEELAPVWSPSSRALIHWFNDRNLTAGNLQPLETSTVDVKYILRLYDGTAVDSSYMATASYGDSLFRTKVTGVISGWQIALQSMHVGDSVRLVLPYTEGYGIKQSGKIKPFSTLQFDIKLVDIPFYEVRPY